MVNRHSRVNEALSFLGGGGLAAYLLVGRWNPERLTESTTMYVGVEPRAMLVVFLVIVALGLPSNRPFSRHTLAFYIGIIGLASLPLYMLVSATWSEAGGDSSQKAYEVVLVGLATGAAYRLFSARTNETCRRIFWLAILTAGLVLFALAIFSARGDGRLSALGGGPNVFGRNMVLLGIAGVYLREQSGRLAPWIMAGAVSVLGVLQSGSRGSFLALVAAVLIILLAQRYTLRRVAGLAFFAALTVGMIWFTPIGDRARLMYESRIQTLLWEKQYAAGRDQIYAQAIAMGFGSPLVGGGLGAFKHNHQTYPHNVLLETFAEGGVVGALLLLSALGGVGFCLTASRRHLFAPEAGAFLAVLVSANVSGDLYDSRGVFVFGAILLGMTSRRDRIGLSPRRKRKELGYATLSQTERQTGGLGGQRRGPLAQVLRSHTSMAIQDGLGGQD